LNQVNETNNNTVLANAKSALAKGQFDVVITLCKGISFDELSRQQYVDVHYVLAVAFRYTQQYEQALDALSSLQQKKADHARSWQEQGYVYVALSQWKSAAQAFHQATVLNPALVTSWRALLSLYEKHNTIFNAELLKNAKQQFSFWQNLAKPLQGAADLLYSEEIEKADKVCRHFLQQHKHHAEGLYVLALIDIQNKQYDEAEFLLESCCELAPNFERARAEYAALLNRIGKYQLALEQVQQLLQGQADNLSYLVLSGVANAGLGHSKKAIEQFNSVLATEPQRAGLWVQLGHVQKSLGSLEEAQHAYKQALKYRSNYGDAYWSLANTKSYQFSEDELNTMQQLLQTPLAYEDRYHIEFALGKGFEDKGDSTRAFEYYLQGNTHQYEVSQYAPELFTEQVNRHIQFFTQAYFEQHTKSGFPDPAPIFILGLPRAGSTLLEQILSSHSKVDATLELHNILSLAKRLNRQGQYPETLVQTNPDYFYQFGEQYIRQTKAYRKDGVFFIDKMPNNFLHVGLIKLILPNAKIIDARRDSMDCCYSCFKQLFAEGQDFTYDLTALGRYYKDYEKLMAHWDEVLPGFVLRVQHEQILNDLGAQVDRMLHFCELEFEDACLTFYNNQRAVQTPSAAQVRKPINKEGVGKWKPVQDNLQSLIQALSNTT
jgi:tetratricopeptide (TPR) repeat protein